MIKSYGVPRNPYKPDFTNMILTNLHSFEVTLSDTGVTSRIRHKVEVAEMLSECLSSLIKLHWQSTDGPV